MSNDGSIINLFFFRLFCCCCRFVLFVCFLKLQWYDALTECGLDALSERRQKHCLKLAQSLPKCVPTSSLIPSSRFECHGRASIRSSNSIPRLPCIGLNVSERVQSHITLTFWTPNSHLIVDIVCCSCFNFHVILVSLLLCFNVQYFSFICNLNVI